jgi:chromosomal replication initiation ATPase DnaA
MSQLPLNLASPPVYLEQNFIRSACNSSAMETVLSWPNWPSYALLLYGDQGCGKTHLGHIWAARAGATTSPISAEELSRHALLDDIERYSETELFHLLNLARERQLSLLLTASKPASQLDFRLPDLTSRLRALPACGIAAPDDELLAALLHKLFSDRQLVVDSDVIEFLLPRMERSFPSVQHLVEAIDMASLSQRRRITIPLVKQVLGEKSLADRF